MKVAVNTSKAYEREIEVELTSAEVEPEFEKGFKEYRQKVKIDGFRKGMVPLAVIKRMYGPAIKAEYLDKIIDKFYKDALIQEGLIPLNQGVIEDIDMTEEGDLKFKAKIEVIPEVEIPDVSKVKLTKTLKKVKDEDIDEQLKRIQQSFSTKKVIDGPVDNGHFIMFDMQMVDPKTRTPIIGQKHENRYLLVGHDEEYKQFSEKVLGMNKDEERFIQQELPANLLGIETGEKVEAFNLTIKEIGAVEVPDIDDEFAKKMNEEFNSIDDLKNAISGELEKEYERLSEQNLLGEIRDELVKRLDVEPPPSLVENFLNMGLERYKQVAKDQYDETLAKEKLQPEAYSSAKYFIVKDNVIKKNKLTISEEEIEKRLEEIAEEQKININRVRRMYKNEKERGNIRSDLFERKINDLLKSMLTIKEKSE